MELGALQAAALGALQGLTEFLPVSSSGHLALAEKLMGLEVESLLAFDVAVHVATLAAVLVAFRRELPSLFGSNLVYGLIKMHHDMETIQNIDGSRGFLGNDLQVGPPHIATNILEPCRSFLIEPSKELQQSLGFAVFTQP